MVILPKFGTPLSPRELQVAEALVTGLSNKLIADKLDISAQTAKFHITNLCRKLGAVNRTHAVALFLNLPEDAPEDPSIPEGVEADSSRTLGTPVHVATDRYISLDGRVLLIR